MQQTVVTVKIRGSSRSDYTNTIYHIHPKRSLSFGGTGRCVSQCGVTACFGLIHPARPPTEPSAHTHPTAAHGATTGGKQKVRPALSWRSCCSASAGSAVSSWTSRPFSSSSSAARIPALGLALSDAAVLLSSSYAGKRKAPHVHLHQHCKLNLEAPTHKPGSTSARSR